MRILWINPVGTDAFDVDIANILKEVRREGTLVDVLSFPAGRPLHLEYHAYEGLIIGDLVKTVYSLSDKYDGIVIGCFYDVGFREAREVSGRAHYYGPLSGISGLRRTSGKHIFGTGRQTQMDFENEREYRMPDFWKKGKKLLRKMAQRFLF